MVNWFQLVELFPTVPFSRVILGHDEAPVLAGQTRGRTCPK